MAIAVYFDVKGMSATKYEEVLKRLEAAGAGAPKGRMYHCSFGSPDELKVMDVYDSPESLEAFGQTLMPILAEFNIDPGQPEVMPVQKIIEGK